VSAPSGSIRDPHALLRLFHLVSPALPVGAFAYSQGLESAVEARWVNDEATAFDWLQGLSQFGLATLDLPILLRLHRSWELADTAAVRYWSAWLMACRETLELREEDLQLGRALARILLNLDVAEAREWLTATPPFIAMFALAAVRWCIDADDAARGYLWAWTENQVLAAVKLIPLGQSAGQRLLHRLTAGMPAIIAIARSVADENLGIGTVSQALASIMHETQYSRLFRS
jgi:urease accessory protein